MSGNKSIRESYSDWAATYDRDRNRTRDLDQRVTRSVLGGSSFRFVVELGCGTGKNTSLLSDLAERVLALDFAEGMLAEARKKISTQNVEFVIADVTRVWPCKNEVADLVACNLVLEHVAELDPVFREAFRALQPDGQFFLSELHPFRQYQGTKARFERGGGTTEIAAFVHHLSDFLKAGERAGFACDRIDEWWHDEDEDKPPRLISFVFRKPALRA